MGREKVVHHLDPRFVTYSSSHWDLFDRFRQRSIPVLEALLQRNLTGYVFGSVARGDVSETSDIDITIYELVSSFQVDLALEMANLSVQKKEIVMATPSSVVKGLYYLGDDLTLSLRLTRFTRNPFDFYRYGGWVNLNEIRRGIRKCGVNKALVVINPTDDGHEEFALMEYKQRAKDLLEVGVETIDERIRVLSRRDKVGRTGVFLSESLPPDAHFESELKQIANQNSLVRRRLSF